MMKEFSVDATIHFTKNENTQEITLTEIEKFNTTVHEYYVEVVRYNALAEPGLTSVVKTFENEEECVDWINSLYFYLEMRNPFSFAMKATKENLYEKEFAIDLEEPTLVDVSKHYDEYRDICMVFAVKKHYVS